MKTIKSVISFAIVIIFFASSGYGVNERIVSIYSENPEILEVGRIEKISLMVKNVNDFKTTVEVYIGSTDDGFRNWMWFENNRYGVDRARMALELEAHEERQIYVYVFGGKTGKYDLVVGPDGTDINNQYDSIDVHVVKHRDGGMFTKSPGLGILGLIVTLLLASKVLLMRKNIVHV